MNEQHLKGANPISEKKEVKGKFRYEQDSKRYHRFQIEAEAGIVELSIYQKVRMVYVYFLQIYP